MKSKVANFISLIPYDDENHALMERMMAKMLKVIDDSHISNDFLTLFKVSHFDNSLKSISEKRATAKYTHLLTFLSGFVQ